jgi:hypothetical protein
MKIEKRETASSDDIQSKRSSGCLDSRDKLTRYASNGLKQQKSPKEYDKEYDFLTKNISCSQSSFESQLVQQAPNLAFSWPHVIYLI